MLCREESSEEDKSNVGIFEGLSFPQVPHTPIIIPHRQDEQPVINNPIVNVHFYDQQQQQQQQQKEHRDQKEEEEEEEEEEEQQQQQQQQQSTPRILNFSSLYITESEFSNDSKILYPELPTIPKVIKKNVNFIPAYNQYNNDEKNSNTNGIVNTMRSFVVGETNSGYEQVPTYDDDSNVNSFNSPPIEARMIQNQDVNNTIISTHQVTNDSLIQNLIGENARLARENQLLKQRMENAGISTAPDVGDTVMERMQTNVQPPAQGVKFVCCGRCKQWLRAPKEAIYVYCQTCDAVNNCSTTVSQQPVQNNSIFKQFLGPLENCFPGIFDNNDSFYARR
jgi:hypothetical protein